MTSQGRITSFKAVDRHELGESLWNDLAERSDEAWLFHRFEFQDALATWPIYSDRGFAVVHPDDGRTVLALVPCHLLGQDTLECFGGPALSPDLPKKSRSEVRDAVHGLLRARAEELGCRRVLVRLNQMAPAWRGPRGPRVNPLLELGYTSHLSQTYVVALSAGREGLWSALHPNCRTHIRKAEKEGCSVRIASACDEDLDIYYDLHCETYNRTGVSPHPRAYFAAIWRDFVATGRAVVFFAEREGRVIAADNEAFYKKAMSGWTAAGRVDAARIGANNFLHWQAMLWALDHGAEIYESGEAFPGARDGKTKGLNDFKKSFGGELYPVFKGDWSLRSEEPEAPATLNQVPGASARLLGLVRRCIGKLNGSRHNISVCS